MPGPLRRRLFRILANGFWGAFWGMLVAIGFALPAAAQFGFGGVTKTDQNAPVVFRADHPFLFLIRDNRSGCILFLGRVADPRG